MNLKKLSGILILSLAVFFLCIIIPQSILADWVIPAGNTDGTGWSNGTRARDGNTATYASHSPTLGWGGWETFSLTAPIWSDRFRVMSDFGYGEVDSVQVDISTDNVNWTTVLVGAVADAAWDTKTYTAQNVQYARFRYHRIATSYIFWLYELQVFETPLTIDPPTVTTTTATSVDENSAVVHGLLNDYGGEPCDMRFQYGLTTSYELGSSPWVSDFVSGNTSGFMITGLSSGLTYHFRAQARNSQGTTDGLDDFFTCGPIGTGWVSPNSNVDATGRWEDIPNSYDDELASFAKCMHPSGDPDGQWGPYIYLFHDSIAVDTIRFFAKDDANIDQAQVEVSSDGVTWTNVYDAAFADHTWIMSAFSPQYVNQARIRFHVRNNGVGLYWELYEFDFYFTPRPVLNPIGPQSVAENDTLTVGVSATDPDGDSLILTAENLPANANFTDNGDGTGSFSFTPDFNQAGVYYVLFIASDVILEDSILISIRITETNRAPEIDIQLSLEILTITTGEHLELLLSAHDPDGTLPLLLIQSLPNNATFVDSGNGLGLLEFEPDESQVGVYQFTVIANDGLLTDSISFTITVLPAKYKLYQNYPNPFNPSTVIEFELPHRSVVRISVYNILGQEVVKLIEQEYPAGKHSITWGGNTSSSARASAGVYFYRLRTDTFVQTKKMLLLK